MKRDMDIIRKVLLELEKLACLPNGYYDLKGQQALLIEGVDCNEVLAHLELLHDAGLYKSTSGNPHWQKFRSLTWDGHDFLDSVRDEQIWAETKKGAAAAGSFTFDILKALAKGFIKKKIKDHSPEGAVRDEGCVRILFLVLTPAQTPICLRCDRRV